MIVKSVVLNCDQDSAFVLFTERAGEWWPANRRHTKDAGSTIVMESTGRFFERSSDGAEVELGVVREFVRARRLLLDWYPGTGQFNPTRVEVAFEPFGDRTRVTITHGPGEAGSELFARNVGAYVGSWDLVLGALRKHAG